MKTRLISSLVMAAIVAPLFYVAHLVNEGNFVAKIILITVISLLGVALLIEIGLFTKKSISNPNNSKGNVIWLAIIMASMSTLFLWSIYFLANELGWLGLLFPILVAVLSDSFAYLIGRKIGKTKLAPTISPNKTKEGFIGGLVIATLVMTPILCVLDWQYSITGGDFDWILIIPFILITLSLSLFSTVGDLSLSMIKRKTGIKDFSNMIPGHGGLLDRMDSHLFVTSIFGLFVMIVSFI